MPVNVPSCWRQSIKGRRTISEIKPGKSRITISTCSSNLLCLDFSLRNWVLPKPSDMFRFLVNTMGTIPTKKGIKHGQRNAIEQGPPVLLYIEHTVFFLFGYCGFN